VNAPRILKSVTSESQIKGCVKFELEISVARKGAVCGSGIRITRVPAEVLASLLPGELRLTLQPGNGHANGGDPWDVETELVRFACRLPHTLLWVTVDLDRGEVLKVERRVPNE